MVLSDAAKMELGAAIKGERDRLLWRGADVWKAARVDPTSLSMFERGERSPRLDVLAKLAGGMGVSLRITFGAATVELVEPTGPSRPQASDRRRGVRNRNGRSAAKKVLISRDVTRERRRASP